MNKAWIIIVMLAGYAQAQTTLTLTGKVVMANNQTPLSFASISIKNAPLGTVTNADGEFEFHIPTAHANDTLVVSFIGFNSFTGAIATLSKQGRDLTIALHNNTLMLREVVVHASKLSAREIVEKATRKIVDNYPTQLFRVEGFLREIESENGHYTILREAALTLEDDFQKKKHSFGETVILQAVRRSYSYSNSALGHRNRLVFTIMDLLENNDVRYTRGMLNVKQNTYRYDSATTYNDRPVYVIRTTNNTDEGTLYIDAETFGFVRIETLRKSRSGNPYYQTLTGNDSVHVGRKTFDFSVDFQEFENKLYVKRMQEHETEDYYDPKTKVVTTAFEESIEFIATQIYTDVSRREGVALNRHTEFNPTPYDEAFWKNFNTAKLSPVSERLIADLEKETSLQQQFKDHNP